MIADAPVMLITNIHDEVLLLKRHSTHKLFPNEWCLPGGKRELDEIWQHRSMLLISPQEDDYLESCAEAIYRECQEELGVKIYVFKDTNIIMMDDHYQMRVYLALNKSIIITKEFPNREHLEYGWFNKQALPQLLSTVTRELIENYDF